MKRVLLTGASGFIGRHCIAPLLELGYEIHAVARKPSAAELAGVRWHAADLLEPGVPQVLVSRVKPTHLLHLAWFVVPGQLISSPENFAWVRASLDLVQEFVAQGGRRLTVCGSGYEYDWNYGYCSETLTPTVPNTVYGTCKLALNLLVQSLASQASLSAAWGRVFFLYGPHEHPQRLVSSVILSLLRGESAKSSHGKQIRDYMHVQDVADGLVAVLDSDVTGSVNVSSGEATTILDIVLTIGRMFDRPELIQLGAIPPRANDAAMVVGQNARIVSAVGWRPKFELESGLRHTVEWWKAQTREGS
ncbi:MAG: NAD(P)-dependent oxidoreductase [Steroidobacteraceae bacterium]